MPPLILATTTLMALSLALWVTAFLRTIAFLNRNKAVEQDLTNPADGASLWMRLLLRNGFGETVERQRLSLLINYAAALAPFILAAVLIVVLPPA